MSEKNKQEELNLQNKYTEVEQEISRIQEECAVLKDEKKRRWKRTGILCGVLLLLGVVISVGTGIYFHSRTQGLARELEEEYSAKREELLKMLEEE